MRTNNQIPFGADWDVIADAVAFIIGHSTPTHRAAVEAMKGFPDAVERFALHLENETEDRRDALVARLRALEARNGGLPLR
jgi:hypothetical protein